MNTNNSQENAPTLAKLADNFADWLRKKNKGKVETLPLDNATIIVKPVEDGFMVSQYLFVFTFAADKNIATRLAHAKLPINDYGAVAAFILE